MNDTSELRVKSRHQEITRLEKSAVDVWDHAESTRLAWQLGETAAEAQGARIDAQLQGVLQQTRNLSVEQPQLAQATGPSISFVLQPCDVASPSGLATRSSDEVPLWSPPGMAQSGRARESYGLGRGPSIGCFGCWIGGLRTCLTPGSWNSWLRPSPGRPRTS